PLPHRPPPPSPPVPYTTLFRSIDRVNGVIILVKPRPEVSVARAMDAATLQLRRLRGLRVGEANSFDLLTSDQVLGIFDSLTFARSEEHTSELQSRVDLVCRLLL